MKIAIINNNWGELRPKRAVGIAAVVRDVALGLHAKKHDVIVFSSHGSTLSGVPLVEVGTSLKARGLHVLHPDSASAQKAYIQEVIPHLVGFDVIHSHVEHVLLPFVKDISTPVVSTIHGAGFAPREKEIFETYPDNVFVALSEGAKRALPYIHFSAVVYNGIDVGKAVFHPAPQFPGYFAWMGRFSENKGVLDAIAAVKQAGEVLALVGFEEKGQEAYFDKIKEASDGAQIRLLDRMIGDQKYSLLGNAKAFLFPIHWEEPFGLIMVEAMACGTPVIAYNRGSVSEIVRDGVTGFIVNEMPNVECQMINGKQLQIQKTGIEGLVEAVKRIGEIDRAACRRHVEENFTVEKMVEGYERVYKKVLGI